MPTPHIKIVLFRPEDPLNLGSITRAMANLGFKNLVIVEGAHLDTTKSKITARRSAPLLESAEYFDGLGAALDGSDFVIGFSTKDSKNTPPVIDLPFIQQTLATHNPSSIALLFGPESIGLTYNELKYCSVVARIPSSTEYDSLNLAQSVMLALYEIRRDMIVADPPQVRSFITPQVSYDVLQRTVKECADLCEFTRKGTSDRVTGLLINFFRRIPLSPRETKIILGFFGKIKRSIRK